MIANVRVSESEAKASGGDRWMLWLIPAALLFAIAADLCVTTPSPANLLLMLIVAAAYSVGALSTSAIFLYLAARRQVRRAGSLAIACLIPTVFWTAVHWTTNLIHLVLTVAFGLGFHGTAPTDAGYATYDWSVGLIGGEVTVLAYDPNDDIKRPNRPPTTGIERLCETGDYTVTHLVGHYYVCAFY